MSRVKVMFRSHVAWRQLARLGSSDFDVAVCPEAGLAARTEINAIVAQLDESTRAAVTATLPGAPMLARILGLLKSWTKIGEGEALELSVAHMGQVLHVSSSTVANALRWLREDVRDASGAVVCRGLGWIETVKRYGKVRYDGRDGMGFRTAARTLAAVAMKILGLDGYFARRKEGRAKRALNAKAQRQRRASHKAPPAYGRPEPTGMAYRPFEPSKPAPAESEADRNAGLAIARRMSAMLERGNVDLTTLAPPQTA